MADLLTHVLIAYTLATLLSWRYEWLSRPLVTVVMVGAVLPDLGHVAGTVLPAATIEATLGIPFSWRPFHLLGGTLAAMAVVTLAVRRSYWRPVVLALALGAGSHYVTDLFKATGTGETWPLFWPLTAVQFPDGGLYVSADRWPALVALALAAVTWAATRRRGADGPVPEPGSAGSGTGRSAD